MKKTLSIFLVAALVLGCFAGCGTPQTPDADRLQIVTTIFPEYDWVRSILGDNPANAELTMLLDSGVDLHSYQPTAADILKISTCDLFIYVGGESDEWVEDVLREATNKDMAVINLLDALGDAAKIEEIKEGMEEHDHDEDEDHDEDHDEDQDEDHDEDHDHEEPELDEHVWLSLKNAAVLCTAISDELCALDAAHSDVYAANTAAYIKQLNALDAEYQAAADAAAFKTLLFGDRFPFRYLTDDYGLDYYAAFAGCSAESEASFETVRFLARKVDELQLPAVLTIEGADRRIAETIIQSTRTKDQKILSLDSMQSTTAKDVQNGASYLDAMEKNLSVLTEALH